MKIDTTAVRHCLKSFDFKTLFREHLGWDNHQARLDIVLGDVTHVLTAVAQKRGFVAFVCPAIPDRATRLKIDRQVTKSAREHFVIYADSSAGQQVWQWVRRESGQPLASRDHRFDVAQSGDALIQRLEQIAVSLDEEEQITVVDVAGRARAAFDVDQVTRKFYDRFKTEHAAFLKLIEGIQADADLQWYTSLMLNRLMFVYFIQKKGFLDGDADYLRNRLARVREVRGQDQFQSFYRYFLLRLFHDGLGKSPDERQFDAALERLLGRVPYLNGGFFEVHPLEAQHPGIDIPDQAFERLFDFFDRYSWHLDERPLRADNEINPDVVGYIFEKYINQKQMGAYYTKEDITEYIAKNTIIPFLFDAAAQQCPIAFEPDSALWWLLRDDPDRYLYPAVRHGVISDDGSVVPEADLPDFVRRGMHDPNARMADKRYNLQQAPAGDPLRLVTETWREYVCRRQRALTIREQLRQGEVQSIDDFITLNLDLWQFARDAIVNTEGPELLRAFWRAIEKVTVLDPTCGSGAFLFAALRILETLYGDCLERMKRFVEEKRMKDEGGRMKNSKPVSPSSFILHPSSFEQVLERIAQHPNERYFILKSVIINNLFGVDLMEEAVEICKLRLFLKLVAQVETVGQIEPLPDIDFNIRAGNTLVGYVALDQVRKSQEGKFGFWEDDIRRIEEDAELVERAFRQFRAQQTIHGGKVTTEDKQELRRRLAQLGAQLDRYLAGEYGVKVEKPKDFDAWRASHEPFHWFIEFYGIMRAGGFDVIIGNPPWAEYSTVKKSYTVRGYKTERSGNLHALCTERSLTLRSRQGSFSFIVQLPLSNSSRMDTARTVLRDGSHLLCVLPFDDRPGKLFNGLQHCRSVIFISRRMPNANGTKIFLNRYQRWATEARDMLFQRFMFAKMGKLLLFNGHFPKLGSLLEQVIFVKVVEYSSHTLGHFISVSPTSIYVFYQEATGYWVKAVVGLPYYAKNGKVGEPAHGRFLYFGDDDKAYATMALLNSSLFYMYFITYGDCFHLSATLATEFPASSTILVDPFLVESGKRLNSDLRAKADKKMINTKSGDKINYAEFVAWKSKPIIDEIDRILAKHYGFTDEELDFIINYDIKYRMGSVIGEDGDDE
jgi:hypothetical protein